MTFHVERRLIGILTFVAFLMVVGLSATMGYLTGWVRGYQEATAIQERGWNQILRTVDGRRKDADLERLLGRPVTEGCAEALYDTEHPVPLRLAVERARRETLCTTEAFKTETETARTQRRRRRLEDLLPNAPTAPPELPAGQVRAEPIAWTAWRPSWLGGPALTRSDLLPPLTARFPRLDLVVEYPFAGDGAWVTLGGCLADGTEARAARKAVYAVPGVGVVLDRTSRTPKHDPAVPGYVDSACSAEWLHDGRRVAKWTMTPQRANDPEVERRVPLAKLIPDPNHRARALRAMEVGEDLEARGVHSLARALQEIHKVLYLDAYPQTGDQRVGSLKMMFDVWARMPAPEE